MLNESRLWSEDAIERQLAHLDKNEVRRAYARADYQLRECREPSWLENRQAKPCRCRDETRGRGFDAPRTGDEIKTNILKERGAFLLHAVALERDHSQAGILHRRTKPLRQGSSLKSDPRKIQPERGKPADGRHRLAGDSRPPARSSRRRQRKRSPIMVRCRRSPNSVSQNHSGE